MHYGKLLCDVSPARAAACPTMDMLIDGCTKGDVQASVDKERLTFATASISFDYGGKLYHLSYPQLRKSLGCEGIIHRNQTRNGNSNLAGNKRIASSKKNSEGTQNVCNIYASI